MKTLPFLQEYHGELAKQGKDGSQVVWTINMSVVHFLYIYTIKPALVTSRGRRQRGGGGMRGMHPPTSQGGGGWHVQSSPQVLGNDICLLNK